MLEDEKKTEAYQVNWAVSSQSDGTAGTGFAFELIFFLGTHSRILLNISHSLLLFYIYFSQLHQCKLKGVFEICAIIAARMCLIIAFIMAWMFCSPSSDFFKSLTRASWKTAVIVLCPRLLV